MYLELGEVEQNMMVERWKKDAGVILIFVSVFVVIRANTS
jgi:hypothetical protein